MKEENYEKGNKQKIEKDHQSKKVFLERLIMC